MMIFELPNSPYLKTLTEGTMRIGTTELLKVTDSGVQILGGYGFIREYPAERWLRNGRGFPTFDGLAIV